MEITKQQEKQLLTLTERIAKYTEELDFIKKSIQSGNRIIKLINIYNNKFQYIENKLKNGETGLNAILTSSKNTQTEIEKVLALANQKVADIDTKLIEAQKQVDDMNVKYTSFVEINNKIEDSNTGLSAILTNSNLLLEEIRNLKDKSKIIYSKIDSARADSIQNKTEIETLKEQSKTAYENIESYKVESLKHKNEIIEFLGVSAVSSLVSSFKKRKTGLMISSLVWGFILIVSIVLLAYLITYIFLQNKVFESGTKLETIMWYRLTLTTPVIFLITFAARQYSKERTLLEKYAFKYATGSTLRGYTLFLLKRFKEKRDDVFQFALDSTNIIFKEPYSSKEQTGFYIKLGNSFGFLKAGIYDISTAANKLFKIKKTKTPSVSPTPTV